MDRDEKHFGLRIRERPVRDTGCKITSPSVPLRLRIRKTPSPLAGEGWDEGETYCLRISYRTPCSPMVDLRIWKSASGLRVAIRKSMLSKIRVRGLSEGRYNLFISGIQHIGLRKGLLHLISKEIATQRGNAISTRPLTLALSRKRERESSILACW